MVPYKPFPSTITLLQKNDISYKVRAQMLDPSFCHKTRPTSANPQMPDSNKNVTGPRWVPDTKTVWFTYRRSQHNFDFWVSELAGEFTSELVRGLLRLQSL
jgi:Tol biopolymer transport system component